MRNLRRAYDKDGREIPPATMANIRERGINTLWATCQQIGCGHEAKVDASRWPNDFPVPDIGLRLRCSKCGGRNDYTMPTGRRATGTSATARSKATRTPPTVFVCRTDAVAGGLASSFAMPGGRITGVCHL
jgi:hypothetical protein